MKMMCVNKVVLTDSSQESKSLIRGKLEEVVTRLWTSWDMIKAVY